MLVVLNLTSCQNEPYDSFTPVVINKQISVKNGRLFFQNKESLISVFKDYTTATDEEIDKLLNPLYQKGFYSLRPIVTSKNEDFLYNHYKEKSKKNTYLKSLSTAADDEFIDSFDAVEKIIGDDLYASFLNSDGEIQIGNQICKYTDVGLFITSIENYNLLEDYLVSKNISKDMKIATEQSVKEAIHNEFPNEGITNISGDLEYFKLSEPETDVTNKTTNTNKPNLTSRSASIDPAYNAFLSNLNPCSPESGLFGSLFGDNNICIDQYQSRRRVKTKAFNYNYFFVYHLGVKCVNQYRGWTGLWRVEAADKIKLIVESAQFEYNANKLLNNVMINNQSQSKTYYVNNQQISYAPNNMTINGFTYTNLNESALPQVLQNDGLGLTFEFFGTGNTGLDNLIQNGVNSSLKASQLNNYFYDGLYSIITSQLRSALQNNIYLPPANRTFVAKFPENGKVIIQKSLLDEGTGIGVREKTFDWGAEIKFKFSDNGSQDWSMSGAGSGNQLIRPTNFRVKIIGAVYNAGAWHGNKFNIGIE
ncbi:hypothetical protein FNW21_02945 [Flavobacterium restrictum]|uniref:Uncharacterized protein n=2 Tax=Flavobacterium restrictum TaxID=2594428 RepID=A0A553EAY3_9FLAO|nr:hypothetical protein FNW21_02945 [Flavobacterium restrictum]